MYISSTRQMKAIVFRNTDTGQHHKYKDALKNFKLGYAYETNTHFVYFPGYQEGFHGIQANMAITEGKSGSLEDWVKKVFGAKDIVDMVLEVGDSIDSVWYPGLYFLNQVEQAVNIKEPEMRSAEQSLRLLIAQLDDLLLYIEPENEGLKTYGHKTRQLLLLACTEVENSWKYYMKMTGTTASGRYFNTNDYVRLVDKLHLKNYKLNLRMYSAVPDITPFLNWTSNNSTESIDWYDAYNKTKHDREAHFSEATLWNCIQAVCANVIM